MFIVMVAALVLPAVAMTESDDDDSSPPQQKADSAPAVSDEIDMLSSQNQIVGVANYSAFRDTPYHQQLFDWVESRTGRSDVRKQMADRLGFDPDEALERVTFGVPADQLGSTPQDLEAFTAILSGSFEQEKVLDAIRKERDAELTSVDRPGDWTVYRLDDVELGFTDTSQMIVVQGADAYRKAAWHTVAGDGNTASANIQSYDGFAPVDRSRMLWMIQRSSNSQAPQSDNLLQTAAAIDLNKGLNIQVVTIAKDETSAKETFAQFKSVSQTTGTGMLDMVGATPLVDNLSVNRSNNVVTATTSMTDTQFQAMIEAVRQMTGTPEKVGIPGEKPSSDADAKKGNNQDTESTKDSPDDDDSSDKGSDFN
jgi:hypothetical protein